MNKTLQLRWTGFFLLAATMVVVGWALVPAHWTSIWYDDEFTDWISPIANRLHDGTRLYAYGLHIPMPPFPFVLVHWLHPRQAVWIDENFLNFAFQSATLLLLYLALAKRLGTGLAFTAVAAAIPIFFSFHKTILYDSLAQFLVTACAVAILNILELSASGARQKRGAAIVLGGGFLTLLFLTKQSTAMGATLGMGAALWLFPKSLGWRQRCINLAATMVFCGLFFCLAGAFLSPWVNFSGMIKDVFLIGSEPKGGPKVILGRLLWFTACVAMITAATAAIVAAFMRWLRPKARWKQRVEEAEGIFGVHRPADGNEKMFQWQAMGVSLAIVIFGIGLFYGLNLNQVFPLGKLGHFLLHKLYIYKFLNIGLGLGLCLTLLATMPFLRQPMGQNYFIMPAMMLVFLPAALFHLLSVDEFRWMQDNNPLIVLAIAVILLPLWNVINRSREFHLKSPGWSKAALAVLAALSFFTWTEVPFPTAIYCTERWPEIKQLAGARLRPEAEGMRTLVRTVREQAKPGDKVLLLPNDPNVEAWFERDRPELSCAIIFTDQYWDRYVDEDFSALTAHPPKVIVIGPRDFWRKFSRIYNLNRGAERLIDLVQQKLLPERYELVSAQPILHVGKSEHMDVYVRKEP